MDYHSTFLTLIYINTQATPVLIFLLLLLLGFSFMISGSEVAFFSLNYKDINLLKTKQTEPYRRIVNLLENPKTLLASMLIANSFINIAIIVISNVLLDAYISIPSMHWLEFLIKVVFVTSLLLLFCEVMPKVMATQNNIRFAKQVAPVVESINYLFKPISLRLVKWSDGIEKRLTNKSQGVVTNEEMSHAIDITYPEESEKNILKGILEFGTITVKQIMKTRMDVSGINYDTNFSNLIHRIEELHYSRLPVFKEDLDEVVGILHTKDLLPYLDSDDNFDWHTVMRSPFFVHEQKLIEDLLQEFQAKRIHFAIVVDEFGGTSGIVTLEDILEEVIGEIKDEFDEEENTFKKLDDSNYIFEGKTMINDVCKIMELPVDTFDTVKGEADSLAGLVLEIAGEIPQPMQLVECGDFEFIALEIIKHRIEKIKVTIKPMPDA
ncbi:MAG: gliding motility-associated protein GldE [Chitinophagaceae bacterium]